MIKGKQAAELAAALVRAGAKWVPVYRPELDANGMPTGGEQRVGCILGLLYVKGRSSVLHIDVPGMLLRQNLTRFEGVLAYDCGSIQKGDVLCVQGARYGIMHVDAVEGLVYTLILDA